MITQAPKGTNDIYGEEVYKWQQVEKIILETCTLFNIEEIRTPIFEHTELFLRGIGETTDIVSKEMYTFNDKADRSLTLKPEGTAGVVRSYLQNKIFANTQPTKYFYITPVFRYEQPQAGRRRQFHQFGIEILGSYTAATDAEVISVAYTLFKKLGIDNITLYINSLGGPACRAKYNVILKDYLKKNLNMLCHTCQDRFATNPLRILDCKSDICQSVVANAPVVLDTLDTECMEHFNTVKRILTDMGIPFEVNPKIVRGLDYYTRTVFEFVSNDIGAQGTVCGGGRYDKLVSEFGGPETGAVGFGLGMERLLLTLESLGKKTFEKPSPQLFLGSIGDEGFYKAQSIVFELRTKGLIVEGDALNRTVKNQMKYANKINAKYVVILGDLEISSNTVKIKNMTTGEQVEIALDSIYDFIIKNN